jgi:catechol 2,3-dioxygenase-like lactoylglutathione lyase family enzyme
MLNDSPIFTTIPASDLDRARAFYGEKLGLTPSQVLPQGDLEYESGGIRFYVTKSAGKSSGEFTQASWAVEDIDATAAELRSRGVTFEEYDLPELGLKTVDGITVVPELAAPPISRTAKATCSG